MKKLNKYTTPLLLLVFALCFSSFGLYFWVNNALTMIHGEKYIGRVIDYKSESSHSSKGRSSTVYRPIIQFEVKGVAMTKPAQITQGWKPYKIGSVIPIYLRAHHSKFVLVDSFFKLWVFPGIFVAIGLMVLWLAYYLAKRTYIMSWLKANGRTSKGKIITIKGPKPTPRSRGIKKGIYKIELEYFSLEGHKMKHKAYYTLPISNSLPHCNDFVEVFLHPEKPNLVVMKTD